MVCPTCQPIACAIDGTSVVSTDPVSRRSWMIAPPAGPTTTASTKIRSPSRSNDVSDFICHLDARETQWPPCGVHDDCSRLRDPALRESLPHRPIVAGHPGQTDGTIGRVLDVQQADPLIGMALTNLRPAQRLSARGEFLGDAHTSILNLRPSLSS